jgi:hypothetical protein
MHIHRLVKTAFSAAILFISLPSHAQPSCDPPPSGLVGWWPGNGNAIDVIGGNNGALTSGVGYAAGEVGEGFLFNANDNAVIITNTPSLQLQNFTVEMWIKRSSASVVTLGTTGNALLFGTGNNGYGFGIYNDGTLFLTEIDVNGLNASVAVTDTNFHHVALTKTNTTVVFYLDGVAYPAGPYSSTFEFSSDASIGGRSDLQGYTFTGVINQVSVYDRALSGTEIAGIFDAGSVGKCTTSNLGGQA